jgi:hypothetical protein
MRMVPAWLQDLELQSNPQPWCRGKSPYRRAYQPIMTADLVYTEFRRNFGEILRNYAKFCTFAKSHCREIFFLTSHTLCCSIAYIKLKLQLFSKLNTNFAVRNFGKISQNLFDISRNHEISFPSKGRKIALDQISLAHVCACAGLQIWSMSVLISFEKNGFETICLWILRNDRLSLYCRLLSKHQN